MDIDFADLASLVALLKEADFSEFRYEKGDVRICVRRDSPDGIDPLPARRATTSAPAPASVAAPRSAGLTPQPETVPAQAVTGARAVTAPMLGTFYTAPKPGEPPFVQVGQRVEPDTVLCIVEVMKLMNSVHAGVRGAVVAVHAGNGELVEFGQTLFSIQEDAA
jgi:acetyl-CoA carboxylase biotin carboxyl carrier protein